MGLLQNVLEPKEASEHVVYEDGSEEFNGSKYDDGEE